MYERAQETVLWHKRIQSGGGATWNTGATLNKFDFFAFRKNRHPTTASGNMALSGIKSQEAQLPSLVVTPCVFVVL